MFIFYLFIFLPRLQRWSWSCCQEGFWSSPSSPSSPPSCSGPGSSWRPTTGKKKHTHTQTGQTGDWLVLTGVAEHTRHLLVHTEFGFIVTFYLKTSFQRFQHITLLCCNEWVPTLHQINCYLGSVDSTVTFVNLSVLQVVLSWILSCCFKRVLKQQYVEIGLPKSKTAAVIQTPRVWGFVWCDVCANYKQKSLHHDSVMCWRHVTLWPNPLTEVT